MSTVSATLIAHPPPAFEAEIIAPASQDGRLVTEEEYWRDYYFESDIHYEWNNGRLEEKPVSDFATIQVYIWLMLLVEHYLLTRPIGRLITLEMGFRLPLPTGTVIRKPDFAVVCNENPQPVLWFDASYHGVFDLCVEALSDRERRGIARDAVTKKAEYAAGGVREYYILHREPKHQAFYSLTPAGIYVPIEPVEGVIRSRVLPGFQFRLEDLLAQPAYPALCDDPVYADFVLPGWRAIEERACQEAARAEAALKYAEAEAARAEAATERAEAEAVRAQAEAVRAQAEAVRAEAANERAEAEAARAQAEADRADAEARRRIALEQRLQVESLERARVEAELARLRAGLQGQD